MSSSKIGRNFVGECEWHILHSFGLFTKGFGARLPIFRVGVLVFKTTVQPVSNKPEIVDNSLETKKERFETKMNF